MGYYCFLRLAESICGAPSALRPNNGLMSFVVVVKARPVRLLVRAVVGLPKSISRIAVGARPGSQLGCSASSFALGTMSTA